MSRQGGTAAVLRQKGTIVTVARGRMVDAVKEVISGIQCPEVEFVFVKGLFSECLQEIRRTVKDVDVFLAGRYHAEMLRSAFHGVPVVTIEPSGFDVLTTVLEASKAETGSTINIVNSVKLEEFENIKCMLRLNTRQIIFDNVDTLGEILEDLALSGFKAVVGGSLVCDVAAQYGLMPYFYISKKTIRDAVYNAFHLARDAFDHRSQYERLKNIIDMSEVALLVTNEAGLIQYATDYAARILGCTPEVLVGFSIHNMVPKSLLSDDPPGNHVVTVNGEKVICEPIRTPGGHIIRLQEAKRIERSEWEVRKQSRCKPLKAKYTFDDIVGAGLKDACELAKLYARQSEAPILILGPSGSGKELFASSIHNYSFRAQGPFVAINCAALPASLLESELFGYEEGAFTGAKRSGKRGLIDLAHKGTLFLDEIGDLPLQLQSKLLRVLEEKEIFPVGAESPKPVDVRIIAATNQDLEQAMEKGTFRSDLYYRIGALVIRIPPLRQRREDIPALIRHFTQDRLDPMTREAVKVAVLEKFGDWPWPGNVRELQNVLERIIVFLRSKSVRGSTFSESVTDICQFLSQFSRSAVFPTEHSTTSVQDKRLPRLRLSAEILERAIVESGGNVTKAAQLLGISRTTLWRKMKAHRAREIM